jgi:hypothetical protein
MLLECDLILTRELKDWISGAIYCYFYTGVERVVVKKKIDI